MNNVVNEVENLVVLVSLSKILGVCGLRVGLMVTSNKNKIQKMEIPYSINILASSFIKKYIAKINDLEKCKTKIKNNFEYFINNVNKNIIDKIIYHSSSFLLIELKEDVDYKKLTSYILSNGVKISAINDYYRDLDKKYIRIGAGKKKDYKKLIKILKKYK